MKKEDKTKLIPPLVALIACFISSVVSIIQQVDFALFTRRLAFSAIVFLCIGYAARIGLWYVFKPEPLEEEPEEGEPSEDEDVTIEETDEEDMEE